MKGLIVNLKKLDLDDISKEISNTFSKLSDVEYEVDELKERLETRSEIEYFIYSISNGDYNTNEEGQKIATELWRKY